MLGALASVLSTWLVTGILLYEAVNRVISPSPVNGKGVFASPLWSDCATSPDRLLADNVAPVYFGVQHSA